MTLALSMGVPKSVLDCAQALNNSLTPTENSPEHVLSMLHKATARIFVPLYNNASHASMGGPFERSKLPRLLTFQQLWILQD
jgi:hypothetical protein